jgi:putative heme iron utilization protein
MSRSDTLKAAVSLIRSQRWAALSTIDADGKPAASMVAYAAEPDLTGLLLHLSRLAAHTRHLTERPAAALVVGEPDCDNRPDPQTLGRISITGTVEAIAGDAPGFAAARDCYLERLPEAAPRFGFTDFILLRFRIETLRYVGGFAAAHTLSGDELRRTAAERSG